jgi:hypothetical protein
LGLILGTLTRTGANKSPVTRGHHGWFFLSISS